MNEGIVYITGAGPGDPELLTIKAKKVLEIADIVVYDNLVNQSILNYCPPGCELLYVGKSGSHHTFEQNEINQLLVKYAKQKKTVVRLKGGDPFIFGRGGEEVISLHENNIAFEIINGISSAYAVAAYAGIPVTHRGIAASVAFVTGHEDPTKNKSDINWQHLARGTQTLVFLMGIKNLPVIVEQLLVNGLDSATPVAIIQNGTRGTQTTVVANLSEIVEIAKQQNVAPPAIIVVGEVVKLKSQIDWYELKPLFGKKIVVTRSREQASVLTQKLIDHGAHVMEMPSIKVVIPAVNKSLQSAIDTINDYDWLVFTSVNGVKSFFNSLYRMNLDSRSLAAVKICAIGSATCSCLKEMGVLADVVPEKYTSSEIINSLLEKNEIEGKGFLLPRADIAPTEILLQLKSLGAKKVDNVVAYRTEFDTSSIDASYLQAIKSNNVDMVTFTSSSTVVNFKKLCQDNDIKDFSQIKCIAIGPITAASAKENGFNVVQEARVYTIDGMIDSIFDYFS